MLPNNVPSLIIYAAKECIYMVKIVYFLKKNSYFCVLFTITNV